MVGNGGPAKTGELPDGALSYRRTGRLRRADGASAARTEAAARDQLQRRSQSVCSQLSLNNFNSMSSLIASRLRSRAPSISILRDVTTAQALDYIFLQEGLFFQKLSRRTILVADQTRRPQYQQLVLRTFFLSNMKPRDAQQLDPAGNPAISWTSADHRGSR